MSLTHKEKDVVIEELSSKVDTLEAKLEALGGDPSTIEDDCVSLLRCALNVIPSSDPTTERRIARFIKRAIKKL